MINKKTVKFLIITLIFLMIILTSVSCKSNDNNTVNNTSNNDSLSVSEETDSKVQNPSKKDPAYEYSGERFDFNGETFTVMYADWSLYTNYYFAEGEIGEVFNDTLYRRQIDTEEFFNIKFQTKKINDLADTAGEMKKEILSDTNSFDIAMTHCIIGVDTIVSQNLAYNWAEMPNVDFSKKYWNQSINENFNINGYMPFVVNNFIIPDPCFVTFNKDLLQRYNIEENPYELVKSGKWTWDKLTEIAKQVSADLDGDDKYTDADLYGFSGELDWLFVDAMYSSGQYLLKRDTDERYVLDIYTEKTQSILDKLYDLMYVGNQSFMYGGERRTEGSVIPFHNGKSLFYVCASSEVTILRTLDFNFGILPYPKFDERQANHIVLDWAGFLCAPANTKNPEKIGAIVEYLGAKSYEIVRPAYFDILLTGKIIRDDESADMLNIIYENNIYDFGLNFGGFNDLLWTIPNLLQKKSTDFTSYYEKNEKKVQKIYDKIYDTFLENSTN